MVLTEREKLILILRFGLGFESGDSRIREHTYEEIGGSLGLSRERIRQLNVGAVKKLVNDSMPNWKLERVV